MNKWINITSWRILLPTNFRIFSECLETAFTILEKNILNVFYTLILNTTVRAVVNIKHEWFSDGHFHVEINVKIFEILYDVPFTIKFLTNHWVFELHATWSWFRRPRVSSWPFLKELEVLILRSRLRKSQHRSLFKGNFS